MANLALDDPKAAAAAEAGALTAPDARAADPAMGRRLPDVTAKSAAEVAAYLDELLNASFFRGNEPENGLVVDGGRPVTLVGAAVNTTFAAIDAAAAAGVELLLVHHTSWPYIDRSLHERKLARLRELGVSLYCAHASLDGADRIGTGFALAELLGIAVDGRFAEYEGAPAGVYGTWPGRLDRLVSAVRGAIGGEPEVLRLHDRCKRVGIVPGAGGLTGWLEEARDLGCDTYLSGEGSMYTRMFAAEAGINLVLAGHYRTEAPGIRGLAARLSAEHRPVVDVRRGRAVRLTEEEGRQVGTVGAIEVDAAADAGHAAAVRVLPERPSMAGPVTGRHARAADAPMGDP